MMPFAPFATLENLKLILPSLLARCGGPHSIPGSLSKMPPLTSANNHQEEPPVHLKTPSKQTLL